MSGFSTRKNMSSGHGGNSYKSLFFFLSLSFLSFSIIAFAAGSLAIATASNRLDVVSNSSEDQQNHTPNLRGLISRPLRVLDPLPESMPCTGDASARKPYAV